MYPYRFSFSQRLIVVGLLTALLGAGDALAQRGDRGGRGRGGGGGGESRSFSRGGGGQSRSFSRGGGGQSRSFSRGGESRSFSRGGGGEMRSLRSAESSRGPSEQFRSSESDRGRAFRTQPSTRTFGNQELRQDFSSRGQSVRSFDRGPQQRPSESQGISRRFEGGDSRNGPPTAQREYTARRPTRNEVGEFLEMRRDGTSERIGDATRRGDVNLGERRLGDDRGRGGITTDARRQDFRARVDESRVQGDRAWSERFGRGTDRRVGSAIQPDSGREIARQDFRGNRDYGNRNFDDNKYQSWRQGASRGDAGKVSDHRDWSGRWRDGDRFAAADQIRNHWRGDWDDDNVPFHSGWKGYDWYGNNNHWNNWGYWNGWVGFHNYRPWYWWGWATAPLLTSWLSYGWGTPYYWDYGPGEYIYCYDDAVYLNGDWYQPAPVYYDNAIAIAERAPDWTSEQALQVEWLPLGVFAVARDGVPDTNMVMQLAVTKDGVIGGTASNQVTAAGFPIEGTVDKGTQRAVWQYTDDKNQRIVMETSVYNLTQSESTGLVHYGPDNLQTVEFVRLERPEAGAVPATAAAAEELPEPVR